MSSIESAPLDSRLRAALVLAACVACGLPLAFGGVEPTALSSALVTLALAVGLALSKEPDSPATLRRVVPWTAPLFAIALFAFLQGALGWSSAPAASTRAATLWWGAGLALGLGAILGRSRRARRFLVGGFLSGAVAQAVYGLSQWSKRRQSGGAEIFGVPIESQPQRLKGAFVNPNHYAMLVVVALLLLQAWLVHGLRQVRERDRRSEAAVLVVLPAALWGLFAATLLLSGSRSGLLALGAGTVVQALLGFGRSGATAFAEVTDHGQDDGRRRARARLVRVASGLGLLVAAVGLVAWLHGGRATERLRATSAGDVSFGARREAWSATTRLLAQAPVLGIGFGAFGDRFPAVADGETFRGVDWEHAHNDWLELAACGGVPSLLLLGVAVGFGVRRGVAVVRRGRRSEDRLAGACVLALLAAAATQEAFDFALLMPGNALALALLLGAGLGTRTTRPQGAPDSPKSMT
jgi:O-antigen ligase